MASLGAWEATGDVAFDLGTHSDDLKKGKLLESETGKWTCLSNNLRNRTASVQYLEGDTKVAKIFLAWNTSYHSQGQMSTPEQVWKKKMS